MDLIEAIQTRHSVRKYTDQPIEVAKLATTAVNQQKFKFILKDGNKVATRLTSALSNTILKSAPEKKTLNGYR